MKRTTLTAALITICLAGCVEESDSDSSQDGRSLSCGTPVNGIKGCWITECFFNNPSQDISSRLILEYIADGQLNIKEYGWLNEPGTLSCEGDIDSYSDSFYYGDEPDQVVYLDKTVTTENGHTANVFRLSEEDEEGSEISYVMIENGNKICFEEEFIEWEGNGEEDWGYSFTYNHLVAEDGVVINFENCLDRLTQ